MRARSGTIRPGPRASRAGDRRGRSRRRDRRRIGGRTRLASSTPVRAGRRRLARGSGRARPAEPPARALLLAHRPRTSLGWPAGRRGGAVRRARRAPRAAHRPPAQPSPTRAARAATGPSNPATRGPAVSRPGARERRGSSATTRRAPTSQRTDERRRPAGSSRGWEARPGAASRPRPAAPAARGRALRRARRAATRVRAAWVADTRRAPRTGPAPRRPTARPRRAPRGSRPPDRRSPPARRPLPGRGRRPAPLADPTSVAAPWVTGHLGGTVQRVGLLDVGELRRHRAQPGGRARRSARGPGCGLGPGRLRTSVAGRSHTSRSSGSPTSTNTRWRSAARSW
jgi:hypothetical protein